MMRDRPTRSGQGTALSALLLDVGERALRATTLAGQIEGLVGLGGRLPLRLGLDSLTTWQMAIYERLGACSRVVPAAELADVPEDMVVLGLRPYGRLLLCRRTLVADDDLVFGYCALSAAEHAMLDSRREQLDTVQGRLDGEMQQALADDRDAQLMLAEVTEGLDRVDPVLVYVGEETFTNTPDFNNLLKGRGGKDGEYLLANLVGRPVQGWTWAEKALVYSMCLLRRAGFRGEELNGRQLSPHHLGRFFDEAVERYVAALPNLERPGSDTSLLIKAEFLAKARAEVGKQHTFYRWVHGVSLLKLQDFYPSDQVQPRAKNELDPAVLAHIERFASLRPTDLGEVMRGFVAATLDLPRDNEPLHAHPIEALLLKLVLGATHELRSDIGMSRCLRQLSELVRVQDTDCAEEANAWEQSEYFCAVVPSAGTFELTRGNPKQLSGILRAISARMRFNGWHYMPGHFPLERKAHNRHFYTPPSMSDTAEWSDQHHRGHIAAGVRYSIRSPGPLHYRGKTYPGFFDLRLMRREGPPYTVAELQAANRHTKVIGLLFQALLDEVAARGSKFRVDAFDNHWFDDVSWPALFEATA